MPNGLSLLLQTRSIDAPSLLAIQSATRKIWSEAFQELPNVLWTLVLFLELLQEAQLVLKAQAKARSVQEPPNRDEHLLSEQRQ